MTVRHARLPAVIVLEILWLFAAAAVFVRIVSAADGPAPSLATVAILVLASFATTRLLAESRLTETQARIVAVAVSVFVLFLVLHTEYAPSDPPWRLGWIGRLVTEPGDLLADHRYVVVGSLAAAAVWLRGVIRWSKPVEFPDALATAVLAVAAIVIAAVVDPPVRGPHPFGLIAVVSFLLGWATLALYQAADADEPIATFAARWSAAFAVVIGAAVVFTFAVAAFDPHALGFLEPATSAVLKAIGVALLYTLGPVAGLIGYLFSLIPLHALHLQGQQQPTPTPVPPPRPQPNGQTPAWFHLIGLLLVGGGITLLVLAFLAVIWFAMRRRARRRPPVAERRRAVERESTLAEDLGALIDGIGRRLRRSPPRSSIEIRRLYQEMLARAEADGLPRAPAATPIRFAPELDARYASDAPSAISDAFVRSRYGLAEVDASVVRDLRARWRSVLRRG